MLILHYERNITCISKGFDPESLCSADVRYRGWLDIREWQDAGEGHVSDGICLWLRNIFKDLKRVDFSRDGERWFLLKNSVYCSALKSLFICCQQANSSQIQSGLHQWHDTSVSFCGQ